MTAVKHLHLPLSLPSLRYLSLALSIIKLSCKVSLSIPPKPTLRAKRANVVNQICFTTSSGPSLQHPPTQQSRTTHRRRLATERITVDIPAATSRQLKPPARSHLCYQKLRFHAINSVFQHPCLH